MKKAAYKLIEEGQSFAVFAELHNVGDRDCALHPSTTSKPGGVTFYSQDKDWVLAKFGRDDWQTDARGYDQMQSVSKIVDGRKVRLFNAYPCDNPTEGLPVNPAMFGVRELVTP